MNKILLAGALALAASGAQAATISFDTDTYGGGTTIPLTTTNWDTTSPPPNPLVLPKWNTALVGDPTAFLTAVTVNVRGDAEFVYRIENQDPGSTSSGTNELLVNMDFTLPCLACSTGIAVSSGVLNINLTTFDTVIDFGGTSGIDFGTIPGTFNDTVAIALANFSFYEGAGDFNIDVAAGSDSNRNISGGDLLEATTWRAGAFAEVIYEFDVRQQQLPVPGPLALMAAGLVGLAGVRRLKK